MGGCSVGGSLVGGVFQVFKVFSSSFIFPCTCACACCLHLGALGSISVREGGFCRKISSPLRLNFSFFSDWINLILVHYWSLIFLWGSKD